MQQNIQKLFHQLFCKSGEKWYLYKNVQLNVQNAATKEYESGCDIFPRNKCVHESLSRGGFKLPANESDVIKLICEIFIAKENEMVKEC